MKDNVTTRLATLEEELAACKLELAERDERIEELEAELYNERREPNPGYIIEGVYEEL
jgi:hypothetical protein